MSDRIAHIFLFSSSLNQEYLAAQTERAQKWGELTGLTCRVYLLPLTEEPTIHQQDVIITFGKLAPRFIRHLIETRTHLALPSLKALLNIEENITTRQQTKELLVNLAPPPELHISVQKGNIKIDISDSGEVILPDHLGCTTEEINRVKQVATLLKIKEVFVTRKG